MNGSRTQMEIHKQTGMNLGNLSTLVKKLSGVQLLSGDLKKPKLTIPIPSNLFEQAG
jgi:DNA-binding transcriptional regulator GbsR (MarR family)